MKECTQLLAKLPWQQPTSADVTRLHSVCVLRLYACPRPAISMADEPAQRFTNAVCLSNPSVRNNLGPVLRCCAAFASTEVMVVGFSKWSTHGAHGSNKVSTAIRCNALAKSRAVAELPLVHVFANTTAPALRGILGLASCNSSR
jgi:hypothetical protein